MNPTARIVAFVAALAGTFALAVAAGAAIDPRDDDPVAPAHDAAPSHTGAERRGHGEP